MSKLQKQLIIAGSVLVAALVLFLVYFGVTKWGEYKEYAVSVQTDEASEPELSFKGFWSFVFKKDTSAEAPAVEQEMRDEFGVLMKNDRHFVHDPVEVEDIVSIHIHNTLDDYTLLHKGTEWVFEGAEEYEADIELLPTLRTNTRYLLSVDYVESADLSNKSVYGLDPENPAVWFELVHKGGSYRVIVGDKTPDNSGYYAMLEGREAIYVLDTGLEESVFLTLSDYISPTVADPITTENVSSLERLSIYRGGDTFLRIEQSKEVLTHGNNSLHRMTFPVSGYATSLANFNTFLNSMMEIECDKTVLFGEALTPEALAELGFITGTDEHICDFTLIAEYPSQDICLHFVENGEDYLIYSESKNIVVSAQKASFEYLNWELISWVSSEIYLMDIFAVETIEIKTPSKEAAFVLSGEEELSVTCNGKAVSVEDFKAVYQTIMYVYAVDWGEDPGDTDELLHMTITLESGEVLDYSFKSVSAVNSFYSLNGSGQFYVEREKVMELRELFESLIV